jgi:gliding motility-associated-like protein
LRFRIYNAADATTPLATSNNGTFTVGPITANSSYWVEAENLECTSTRAKIDAAVNPLPQISFVGNITILLGDSVQLVPVINSQGPISTYAWLPTVGLSNATIANPIAKPTSNTVYELSVTDALGCVGKGTINVELNKDVQLPNFLTFNNDGKNENLLENVKSASSGTLTIYNRYGVAVYSKPIGSASWDAADMPAGTYYYIIEGKRLDGQPFTWTGPITLTH